MRKKNILGIIAIQASLMLSGLHAEAAETVSSPDGNLRLTAEVKNGKPQYSLKRGDRTVINPSCLGFMLSDGPLCDCFRVLKVSRDTHDEVWAQPWGETDSIRNNYNELTLRMQETKGAHRKLNVVFRVFNDGIGFRYEFPEQNGLKEFRIMDELTEFAMPSDAKAWSQPTNGTKYYEALYTCEPISRKDTVSTPMTIEAADDLYMAIHEANLTDYASLNLTPRPAADGMPVLTAALTPWQSGVKVYAKTPSVTPWRTVTVADTPGGLITSYIALNLNEPCCRGLNREDMWAYGGECICRITHGNRVPTTVQLLKTPKDISTLHLSMVSKGCSWRDGTTAGTTTGL